jgi:glucose-6-phosphate 1-dehydrogenase
MTIKDPGPGGMRLTEVPLDMTFAEALGVDTSMPDAYERLIMDVIRGDQTLFMRGDEVEAAWEWLDPITAAWEASREKPSTYDPGSSGPEDALMLMHRDGRRWREIGS